MDDLAPEDELRHRPGAEPTWQEVFAFDFAEAGGGLGGYLELLIAPNLGWAQVWACATGEGRGLVTVLEHDAPLPRRQLELRGPGLWLDLQCEIPFEHFTVGLEAFGLGVQDPAECFGDLRGDLVPLGFDLEWETDVSPVAVAGGVPGRAGYELFGRVHGEVLVGQEQLGLDGFGHRSHDWGGADRWAVGWGRCHGCFDDGEWFLVASGTDGTAAHRGPSSRRAGSHLEVTADLRPGPGLLPRDVVLMVDGGRVEVEPVAWAPVGVRSPGGRRSRLARALVRLRAEDGREGAGWLEVHRPVDAAGPSAG